MTSTSIKIGTSPQIEVFTKTAKKNYTKKLITITPPTSTGNKAAGPKSTKIVDTLRIELRLTITGYIASTDEANLEAYFKQGGVVVLAWKDGTSYNVNFEKVDIGNDYTKEEQDEVDVMFTCVVGVDI
jgi:hypothetical protein